MNELERLIAGEVSAEQRLAATRPHGVEPRALALCADFVALMKQHGREPLPLFDQDSSQRVERLRFKGSRGRQYVGVQTTSYRQIGEFWPMWQNGNVGGMTGVQERDAAAVPIRTRSHKDVEDREFVRQMGMSRNKPTADKPGWRSFLNDFDAPAVAELTHKGELQVLDHVGVMLLDSNVTRAVRHLLSTGSIYIEPDVY